MRRQFGEPVVDQLIAAFAENAGRAVMASVISLELGCDGERNLPFTRPARRSTGSDAGYLSRVTALHSRR
jgi:hypothetical protein